MKECGCGRVTHSSVTGLQMQYVGSLGEKEHKKEQSVTWTNQTCNTCTKAAFDTSQGYSLNLPRNYMLIIKSVITAAGGFSEG